MVTVPEEITYDTVLRTVGVHGLMIMGGVHEDGGTIMLLGPDEAFWPILNRSAEGTDDQPDPVDRWSQRVVTQIAETLGAEPLLPFGGPPYQPFLRWAMASGRAWQSPVGMLVHDTAGMMVSFRGALRFDRVIDLPATPGQSPCETCVGQPCATACPVSALSDRHFYNTDACHGYLDSAAGEECMTQGCIARRACPVSQRYGRKPEQSAHHMRYFHRQ